VLSFTYASTCSQESNDVTIASCGLGPVFGTVFNVMSNPCSVEWTEVAVGVMCDALSGNFKLWNNTAQLESTTLPSRQGLRGIHEVSNPTSAPENITLRVCLDNSGTNHCGSYITGCTVPAPPVCASMQAAVYNTGVFCAADPFYLTVTAMPGTLDVTYSTPCSYGSSGNMTCGGGQLSADDLNSLVNAASSCDVTGLTAFASTLCAL
jgi:hypothetical protein